MRGIGFRGWAGPAATVFGSRIEDAGRDEIREDSDRSVAELPKGLPADWQASAALERFIEAVKRLPEAEWTGRSPSPRIGLTKAC